MSSSVSNTISGGISFSGIGSNTDFTAMIAQMKQVEEIPKNRMTLWQGEWEYRTAAMEEVLTVMQESKSALASYNSMSKMLGVSIDSSKEEVATATMDSDSDITEGNYSVDVKQLATSNLFSTKVKFPEKTTVINETDEDQEFSYTYQGTTRTITVNPGTTVDQLRNKINNDAKNPGVRASLIKNGDSYMFQVQGVDTGIDSSLSISSTVAGFDNDHLFTGENVRINNTGSTQEFRLYHEGKSVTMDISEEMTAGEFVEAFNTNSKNPGVTASLVREGSDYVIAYKDTSSKRDVNPPVSSDIPALGGGGGFTEEDPNINDSSVASTYTYSYAGKNYTVPVAQDLTLKELAQTINDDTDNPGVKAEVVQDTTTGKWSIEMTKTQDEYAFPPTDPEESREVSYKDAVGKEHKFDVESGTTMKEYVAQFNTVSKANNSGITASIGMEASSGEYKIYYSSKANTNDETLTYMEINSGTPSLTLINGTTGTALRDDIPHDEGTSSTLPGLGEKAIISGKDTIVNNSTLPSIYDFSYNGTKHSIPVMVGDTLEDFVAMFNTITGGGANDLQAKIVEDPSGYNLVFTDSAGKEVQLDNVQTDHEFLKPGGDNWNEQEAQDALFTINGWEDEVITSSSNKLDEVIEGMTITLKSVGETQLSIATDTSKLAENVGLIIDSFNLIKGTILQLQDVDTDKAVASPDEDVLSSQFTWQAGSALTGNYGVQMLLSEFSGITSSAASGFIGQTSAEDVLNDAFTALSQIGISTVTNPAELDFGLLRIDTQKLDEAIKKNPNAVAELFSAQLTGSTNSSDFSIASAGLFAKAGTYDVDYTVDDNGSVTDVYINGAKAENDPAYPGRFTVADQKNDALGIAIQFNSSGLQPGTHKGDIRVKQGKVNEMISFLGDELKRTSVDGEPQGTLPTIISNYADISKNIQTKIDSETKRIDAWETRKRLEFARLDTLLGQYNAQLESQASLFATSSS